MNVESQLKTPLTHIRNLVKHVNKRNFNESSEQIKQVSDVLNSIELFPTKFQEQSIFVNNNNNTRWQG